MLTELPGKTPADVISNDYMRNQSFRDDIVTLGGAVEVKATDVQLWIDLTDCYQNIQRWDLAQHTLEKGLRHNPASKELSFALIRLLIKQENWGEALVMLRSCERDLITDMPLFAEYCGLLWDYDQIADLEKVLSRWSEEINEEPFFVYYQIKILLLQQRSQEAATILVDFFENKPTTKKFTDLIEEVCQALFPYKFPLTNKIGPALLYRLIAILEAMIQIEEVNPGFVLFLIKLALVEKQYEKAMQTIDYARQLGVYCELEAFQSSVDYYTDICTIMTSENGVKKDKLISLRENHASDVDYEIARFLNYWKMGIEEKWLPTVEALVSISAQDDSPILWCLQFFRDHGQLEQALMVAELWKKMCPHATQAAIRVAELLADLGRIDDSVEGIREILRQEEYISGDKRNSLMRIALKTGDFTLLEQIAISGDEIGNLSLTECVNYYRMLMDHGKYGECIELMGTRQARNEAEEILLGNLLCDAYHYANENDAAFRVLNKAEAFLGIYAEQSTTVENSPEIKEALSQELLFHTTPASVYLRLAVLHRDIGDYQNHAACIEKAYNLAYDHPICQYAWLVINHKSSQNELPIEERYSQIGSIENSTGQYGNACDFFGELLTAERIHDKVLEGGLASTACTDLKSAKLTYGLLSPSDKFLTLCPPKVGEFSARIMQEIDLGDIWRAEYGENSIFFSLLKDDRWFHREKELSHFLPYRLRLAEQYLEHHPASGDAEAAYRDAVIRAYFWQTFLGELGIQADQSTRIDEGLVRASFDQEEPDSLDPQIQLLWAWFKAIQSNQVILVDKTVLDGFTDELLAYYLVAIRKTNTKIHVRQLTARADSNNFFLLLQLAFSMLEFGEKEKALEVLNTFPLEMAEDPILHCVIARAYAVNHTLGKAIRHLDVALAQYWHVMEWHEWMAGWAYDYEDNGKAALHLEILHNQSQGNTSIAILLTHSYLRDKRLNKAKKLLDQLIKRDSGDDDGDKGDVEALKVLYFASKQELDLCIRYLTGNPCNSPLLRDAYLAAANLAVDQEKSDLAMCFVRIAYGYQPSHHATLITLAKVLISSHHFNDARKILDQVNMSINPSVCFEKLKLLETIHDENHYSEQLLLAYELFPQHPGIMYRLAQYLAKTERGQKASELLGTLFAHSKPTVEQLVFAGELHLKRGNLDKAISYMSDVIQIDSDNTKAYLTLASAYVHQRQYSAAMEVYERAITQKPADHQAYYQAGILMRDLKRFQEAESFLQKAVKLAPNNWEIRNQLGAVMALNFIDHHH
ncbi:MAG TPA: tetratricopeptide repeat protein [Chloroflexi bacterium]|nr:tetratricopeptide repeat protein [Chloroflexota bacterium]